MNDLSGLNVQQDRRTFQVMTVMRDEIDRWSLDRSGDQDVVLRQNDAGQLVEISRHSLGDGEMYFYDMRDQAVVRLIISFIKDRR